MLGEGWDSNTSCFQPQESYRAPRGIGLALQEGQSSPGSLSVPLGAFPGCLDTPVVKEKLTDISEIPLEDIMEKT